MKKRLLNTVKFLLFLGVGLSLLWLIYKDADFDEISTILKDDFKYSWVIFSLFIGMLSHISRTLRWKMLIEPTGKRASTTNTLLAVMVGYIANLALPRMGEISRCAVLSKYEGISFTKLVGTVVFERALDVLTLLLFALLAIGSQFTVFGAFLDAHPAFMVNVRSVFSSPVPYSILVVGLMLLFLLRNRLKKTSGFNKIKTILKNFWSGLIAVKHMERKWLFIGHSLFIWICYFLMTYVCFFAFDFTAHLSPFVGMFIFVMASFGMVAPVQGGFGPWHFMVIQSLLLYGVAKTPAATFAFVVHGSMTLMLIIVGFIALIALPIVNRDK